MVLQMRRQDNATQTTHISDPTNTVSTASTVSAVSAVMPDGPVGAPKASEVKEVLLVLRSRLELQLEDEEDYDPAMLRALRGNIRSQLEQINEALTRIDGGKYGVCATCLKPIEADRLVVRPYSTLCMACQSSQDRSKGARLSI
jgi:RNA polymerase-binding transcription factor DksA